MNYPERATGERYGDAYFVRYEDMPNWRGNADRPSPCTVCAFATWQRSGTEALTCADYHRCQSGLFLTEPQFVALKLGALDLKELT